MRHIVFYSGGVGSWGAARRVVEQYGKDNAVLLFTDVRMEDEDLYRFVSETAAKLQIEVTSIADGRTPWDVFFDERFLGNSRADPCSKLLKRELARKWIYENFPAPSDVVLHFGIDWTELHRQAPIQRNWLPYKAALPLCEKPLISKAQLFNDLDLLGIAPPRLYELGFSHNNCGGFCVKAGMAHFALLLKAMPERYAYHERKEQELREYLGKDVAILTDRSGGGRRPLTLKEFRERQEAQMRIDLTDIGGCGCFTDADDDGLVA